MTPRSDARSERIVVVVNPRAGGGRAAALEPALASAFRSRGLRFELVRTAAPRDATRLVRHAIEEGATGVAIVGGDGTLSEAANGFFDEDGRPVGGDTWLGPLSCGTGGDFRRTLGTANARRAGVEVEDLVEGLVRATPRAIDAGWIEHLDHEGRPARRAFLNIASFGVAGLVDQLVNASPKWMSGTPAFLVGTLKAVTRYRPKAVRVTVGEAPPREVRVINCAVANGRYFGGGMQIAPEACLDDGVFDVVSLEGGVLSSLPLLPRVYGGTHLGRTGVTATRAATVRAEPVDAGDAVLLDVDGEAPGVLPATFTIRPGALRLRG